MKKIKLSNRLKSESIYFLKQYLTDDRKRPLKKRVRREIKKLIEKRQKNLGKFSTEIMKSPLFTLAVSEIIREGHSKYIFVEGKWKYDITPAEIMLMMLKIVDLANRQGQKKMLEDYCKGTK